MEGSHGEAPHALVVPGPGEGHINGAILLSQSLAAVGFEVSFVYSSSKYSSLKESKHLVLPAPEETQGHSSCRSDVGISSQSNGSMSDGTGRSSATADHVKGAASEGSARRRQGGCGAIRIRVVEDNFKPGDAATPGSVTPAMKENLLKLIVDEREQGHTITCLVSDRFAPWTVEVAQRAVIPRIEFWSANAMAYLLLTNLGHLYSEGIFPEKGSPSQWKTETPLMLNHIPGLPPFSSELMPPQIRFANTSDMFVQLFLQMESLGKFRERVLIHTVSELEPSAFRAFEVQGIPAYAIGPLFNYRRKPTTDEQAECISWLDSQPDSSIIYIAFGSRASLSVEEVKELAMGLEASGHTFLWVIREDTCKREELSQVLPEGFLERTSGKGLIISWAPQVEVLAHKAVGGFLSHCGWNSTFESLCVGVPLLCCPRDAEQRLNTHYLCDVWGAGMELGRTDTGGLERSFVELGVKALLDSEEGAKARSKAQEIMHMAKKASQKGGPSFANLQQFYDDMRRLRDASV